MTDEVEVWLDADFTERTRVGTLAHDRGMLRFIYEPIWLKNPQAFALDPDLSLGEGTYFPNAEAGNFRVFDDSAPDRWGQTLMKRREALAAKDEGRRPRTLYAWDFLLGVEDISRQGALRYCQPGNEAFLAHETLAVPPVASLKELEVVAREITAKRIDDLGALRHWLKVLVAPGASLGGARPKASYTETNGSLWIAKFPAGDDARDVGAWEALAQHLAARAGVEVPTSELRRFSGEYHTFCVQRFDRSGARRRFYASAMALLRKDHSEGTSYLELAEFLQARGAKDHIASDLEQLFRRVAFNVAIGNRDDHLRNHGFLLTPTGWRLAPAFDLNPNTNRADHVLNIDESDNRPSLATVIDTSEWYVDSKNRGQAIVEEVLHATRPWREAARALKKSPVLTSNLPQRRFQSQKRLIADTVRTIRLGSSKRTALLCAVSWAIAGSRVLRRHRFWHGCTPRPGYSLTSISLLSSSKRSVASEVAPSNATTRRKRHARACWRRSTHRRREGAPRGDTRESGAPCAQPG